MRRPVILSIGLLAVLVTLFLARPSTRKPASIAPDTSRSTPPPIVTGPPASAVAAREAAKPAFSGDMPAPEMPQPRAVTKDFKRPPRVLPAIEQRLDLDLSEAQIRKLEEALPELHRQAYTTAREDGWELHLLREDSLFTRLGFQDGDLITYRSLDGHPAWPELAGRIVALLQAIEK